jgi:type VI secretion system protein ImpH
MYALVGLGNKSVRDKLAINHSKMLAYAGILATPGRSPDVVCNLVSHCFDLPDVVIDNWQLRKVPVDLSQQNRLVCVIRGCPSATNLLTPWSTVFNRPVAGAAC